jgi:hypothetical protein
VVQGDSVRAGTSLASALGVAPRSGGTVARGPAESRMRAESLYTAMREALRRGDWPAFGRAFDALGGTLQPAPR